MTKVLATLVAVVLAVGVTAGLWIGANMLFAQTTHRWRAFGAISGAVLGLLVGIVVAGNRLVIFSDVGPAGSPGDPAGALGSFAWIVMWSGIVAAVTTWAVTRRTDVAPTRAAEAVGGAVVALVAGGFIGGGGLPALSPLVLVAVALGLVAVGTSIGVMTGRVGPTALGGLLGTLLVTSNKFFEYGVGGLNDFSLFVWFPLLQATVGAGVGWLLNGQSADGGRRLAIGVGGGAVAGLVTGGLLRVETYPSLEPVPLIAWTVAVAAIGAGISLLRGRPPVVGGLYGGAVGWILGAWGSAEIGAGNAVWAMVAMAVPFLLVGLRVGLGSNLDASARGRLDNSSRAWIFLGPAMLFIFGSLVVPTIRTLYLSLLDRRSETFVGLQNYISTFQNRDSFDPSGFADLFTSRMLWVALLFLAVGGAIALVERRRVGRALEIGGPAVAPLGIGVVLFLFALFTAVRGTIINNLWWVVVVVVFSTVLGLAVAVLADGVTGERIAKSIIFMPMAISLVGASIIWRFMYTARDTSVEQTGVLNAVWVGMGAASTGGGTVGLVVGIIAAALAVGAVAMTARYLTRGALGGAVAAGSVAALMIWFALRWWSPGGLGGVTTDDGGELIAQTVLFIQERPYNSFWLMLVLVWIQTGFAMVIFSAAIRSVPSDLLEAAQVDGATESQVFWRVTLPQIATTIGVVVTTLIVVVMKVFDIVKVMTNGQFGTQVLANDMFQTAFNAFDTGRGAALAILILVSVLPVMIYNVRKLVAEEA